MIGTKDTTPVFILFGTVYPQNRFQSYSTFKKKLFYITSASCHSKDPSTATLMYMYQTNYTIEDEKLVIVVLT